MAQIDLSTLLQLVGTLDDSTEPGSASQRFREYLRSNLHNVEDVRDYVSHALSETDDQSNKALQDLINHAGHLLGFDVVFGRYRGTKAEIGFDGLWKSPAGSSLVVESKTTDVYTVKTATLLDYINSLVSEGSIDDPTRALGLYVYGRFDADTNQLENAIIAENRRQQLRVVSVDALLNLLQLKQEYELTHDTALRLLLPTPVRVDPLVNLIVDVVAEEKEEADTGAGLDAEGAPGTGEPAAREPARRGAPPILESLDDDYTGKTVSAVVFRKRRHEVHTWKEAALAVFAALRAHDPDKFDATAVTVVGRKRPYISTDPSVLRKAGPIPGTDLHFETNLSADSLVKLCLTLMVRMGFDKASLVFEAE
jgi:hypothetical protein